jgi:nitrogen fixation/metabolism regulation signal transduction histidine kinase
MDFRLPGILALTWRIMAIGALIVLATYLFMTTQLYATAIVVAGVAALITVDLARTIARADRSLELFLEGLAAGTSDMPARRLVGFSRLRKEVEKTAAAVSASHAKRQQDIEYLRALLDTVSAVLIVAGEGGKITLANRAARKLVHGAVVRLEDIPAIGAPASSTLLALAPGARQIVKLADGHNVLATVTQFSVAGSAPQRLIALQRIAGDLDAVESKAWQDVARVLAHEMMNSLTPISSLSESLEQMLRSPGAGGWPLEGSHEIADAIEAIRRRSTGLMNFVERYRKVAELPQPAPKPVRADGFVANIDRLMRATMEERGIAYASWVIPNDLTLNVDAGLLEQAVINLLRNAIEAVEGVSSPSVELRCEMEDGEIVIAVSDNGRGIPTEGTDDVFLPFFSTKPGGSGIGLSLARQIALAHGGRADVQRQVKGATLLLVLPASVG